MIIQAISYIPDIVNNIICFCLFVYIHVRTLISCQYSGKQIISDGQLDSWVHELNRIQFTNESR